ncbi:MAG TPA: hypothetical protein VFD92_15415 [Candidatus Binatia bacterium]|nr:hypothetical protein [Candidatus Binatia bacterium]
MTTFAEDRLVRRLATLAVLAMIAGCAGSRVQLGMNAVKNKTPVASIEMHEVQAAYMGSASGGAGTLFYQGQEYPFDVGALGVGGIGLSTVEATGEVYDMQNLSQFPGTYGQARYGFALGTESRGDLWLQNEAGVILHLNAKRTGLMLTLGGDAVVIKFTQPQ